MKQNRPVTFAWGAVFWLTTVAPASAHPDPGTQAGAVTYLVAAGITAAIFALILSGSRIASWLRSAFRSR